MRVQQVKGIWGVRTVLVAGMCSALAPQARADIGVTFGSGQSDFTNNFYLSRGVSSHFVWQAGGWMRFDNAAATYSGCVYDTKVPPSNANPLTLFGGGTQKEIYSMDFLVGHEKESAGICARIQGSAIGNNGYGVWLNLDAGTKTFVLYKLTSPVAGTSLATASLEPNLIVADTWYTLTMTIQNLSGSVQIEASIKNRATNAPVGGAITFADTTGTRATDGGRVGARLQIGDTLTYTDFDNLSATLVPDPPQGTVLAVR